MLALLVGAALAGPVDPQLIQDIRPEHVRMLEGSHYAAVADVRRTVARADAMVRAARMAHLQARDDALAAGRELQEARRLARLQRWDVVAARLAGDPERAAREAEEVAPALRRLEDARVAQREAALALELAEANERVARLELGVREGQARLVMARRLTASGLVTYDLDAFEAQVAAFAEELEDAWAARRVARLRLEALRRDRAMAG